VLFLPAQDGRVDAPVGVVGPAQNDIIQIADIIAGPADNGRPLGVKEGLVWQSNASRYFDCGLSDGSSGKPRRLEFYGPTSQMLIRS
jgi:hypothetical protein